MPTLMSVCTNQMSYQHCDAHEVYSILSEPRAGCQAWITFQIELTAAGDSSCIDADAHDR
jgi:hypothetical protein